MKKKWCILFENYFRMLCFSLIFAMLFYIFQIIVIPKRFPYSNLYEVGKMRYFKNEDRDSIDVLICGTSHAGRGILPMELYGTYGIKAYNLSTSAQRIETTYFTLMEALRTQTPEILIVDVSNLYFEHQDLISWKYIMDDIPPSKNKVLMAREYMKNYDGKDETIRSIIFPLLEYHTRWKELTITDFDIFNSNKNYFGKGGNLISFIAGGVSADEMNMITDGLIQNTERILCEYNAGEINESREENIGYSAHIPETNVEWLLKIKEVCEKNDIYLLAVKVPSVYWPQAYASAWTKEKYHKMRNLCEEYGIDYYDLLYDTDVSMDYGKDSQDGGCHLNLYGAQKVSADLGKYIEEHYDVSGRNNAKWDKDLTSYQKVRQIALLELEQDFVQYINKLVNEYQDKMIFIAASEDMAQGLNDADINILRVLGLQMDFSNAFQDSYIAVIDNGKVLYEALSNRPLSYNGIGESGLHYALYSSGWWSSAGASITINGAGYAMNGRGLNIVVYDDERGLVLDSVCFDTSAEYHTPARNNGMINNFEETFERYIMEVEDK